MDHSNNPSYHHHHQQNPSPSDCFILPDPASVDPIIHQNIQYQDIHRRDRLTQWTQSETKALLSIRSELDRSFTQTKRNKPLWEAISAQMHQQGFSRTPDQCKSKWKNLVTRYKASEANETGDMQFPLQQEMRSIFAERLVRFGKGEEEDEIKREKQKRRRKGGNRQVEEAIKEFGRKQMEMEARWLEAAEAREAERRWKEEDWRREMETLAEERMEIERRWREKEEERRAKEEARDDRRHAVISAILTKMAEKNED